MRLIIFILLAVVLISLSSLKTNAISFASDHLENDTLVLISGDSKIYGIRLQNPSDSPVSVKIEYDNTLMKIIDYREIYNLGPKETGYSISFNVTAPKKPGIYDVGYTVMEVEAGGGGLPIRLKINRNFKLKVTEEIPAGELVAKVGSAATGLKNLSKELGVEIPNKFHLNTSYVAYAAIALSFVLYILYKKRTGKISRRKSGKFL